MAKQFLWEARQLIKNYPDGSYKTRAQRKAMLTQMASELKSLGYKHLTVKNFKRGHIETLVKHWNFKSIHCATMKNRMSALRWLMRKAGRPKLVPTSNRALGIQNRVYIPKSSRATELTRQQLLGIRYPEVRLSLLLQSEFGLRREESLKFRPMMADRGTHIQLQGSWCKGGRPRAIPILTQSQRVVLDAARQLAGRGSMIPENLSFKTHQYRFDSETRRVGLNGTHGLRHAYAQSRYAELTGWHCPLRHGPCRELQSSEQREIDHNARLVIAEELGHGRTSVTIQYLGR